MIPMMAGEVPADREPSDATLPARLRDFHERLPLAAGRPNVLLSLPDGRLLYLAALLRDTPVPAPALSAEEWQAFLDLLRPHWAFPLLAYRLRAWPEDCRPPAEVMAWLNRVFLYAAARAMRAGRQIQAVVDALEAAGIESLRASLTFSEPWNPQHSWTERMGPSAPTGFLLSGRRKGTSGYSDRNPPYFLSPSP